MNTVHIPDGRYPVHAVKDLGAVIRAARRQAGLDQKDAAGLAGVGLRFLSDLERGKPTVRMDKVLQVLDAMGLELTVRPRRARHG